MKNHKQRNKIKNNKDEMCALFSKLEEGFDKSQLEYLIEEDGWGNRKLVSMYDKVDKKFNLDGPLEMMNLAQMWYYRNFGGKR